MKSPPMTASVSSSAPAAFCANSTIIGSITGTPRPPISWSRKIHWDVQPPCWSMSTGFARFNGRAGPSTAFSDPCINIHIDPARIAYGVMTGVGFLGAGAIVRFGGSVRGLTTAAAMWCVAAIGLAMGFGMYVVGALAAVITVSALWLLDYFEDWIPKTRYRTVTVRHKWES